MDDWYEEIVVEVLWKALKDAYADVSEAAHDALQHALDDLTAGKKLSSSPLVQVIEVTPGSPPDDHGTATVVIRGRQFIVKKAFSAFERIQIVISRTVAADLQPPVRILDWQTVVGDLKWEKAKVFLGELGFGWDRDHWLGRGTLKIEPARFGLDILLGGLNDRGLMLGIDLRLPVPIPLGPTGVALIGIGGDFAYNFKPDLGLGGPDPIDPTAADYLRWARDHELDHWEAAPIEQTAVGIGIHAGLGDVSSNGFLFKLDPIGLMVLIPGPVFVLGGAGMLLNTRAIKAEGYLVVDVPSGSLAMGLGATVRYPPEPAPAVVEANGTFDALFSFNRPGIWYVHLGTEAAPISGKVLRNFLADLYLELDADGVRFGAGIGIGGEWHFSIIKLIAKAGARVKAKLGYDPFQLEGLFQLWGELGISVWEFDFKLEADASAIGRLPNPTQLVFKVHYKLDLPWPIPDIEGSEDLKIGEDPTPPKVAPALRSSVQAGPERLRLGALHAMTGRQWDLAATVEGGDDAARKQGYPWPDSELVIPFTQPAADQTGTAINPFPGTTNQGGYDVTHRITKIELRNLIDNTVVTPLRGVWVAGPDGTTGRLHLLGTDPFAWLSPHTDVLHTITLFPGGVTEQRFGYGPAYALSAKETFGDVRVIPERDTELVTSFQPGVPTRVLRSQALALEFRKATGASFGVDRLTLLALAGARERGFVSLADVGITTSRGPLENFIDLGPVYGDLHLVAVDVRLGGVVQDVELTGAHEEIPFHVVGVRYREADRVIHGSYAKTLMVPARYRLTVEGGSEGAHPDPAVPNPDPVPWSQVQEFEVKNPESLRPYIGSTTLGDPRVFGAAPAWDPTPVGLGFPGYRRYRPVVRFLVPYMHGIFPTLRTRIAYHDSPPVEQDLAPSPAPDGATSLPAASAAWFAAHGGAAPADEELVVGGVLPAAGPAAVSVAFPLPDGAEIRLDEWPATVSRFGSFSEHLAWSGSQVMLFLGPTGAWIQSQDCAIPTAEADAAEIVRGEVARVRERYPEGISGAAVHLAGGGAMAGASRAADALVPIDWAALLAALGLLGTPYPTELTSPPFHWRLPTVLTQEIGPLDQDSVVRFARFAAATGVAWSSDHTVLSLADAGWGTRIDAVGDEMQRPYALWLRTEEPIDWRRVTASMRIEHVVPPSGCPTALAHRHPLDLEVSILPGPDASSAFIIGSLAGVPTRLPRGVCTLTLRFSPGAAGLPTLRPDPDVGAPETVALRFVQNWGLDWPLPEEHATVPNIFLEWATHHPAIPDPGPLHALFEEAQRYADQARLRAIDAVARAVESTTERVERLPLPPLPEPRGMPDLGQPRQREPIEGESA